MGQELPIAMRSRALAACNMCGSSARTHLFSKKGYDLVQCGDCGLAYIANPPDAEGVRALYSATTSYHRDLLDSGSDEYQRQRASAHQHVQMLRHFHPRLAGELLLDIGCSSGIFLGEARAMGMVCIGTEICPETAEFAHRHYSLPIHAGEWRDAGFADASFDVITMFDVIEHLPDPLGELVDLRRLLRPDGLLLLSTPDIDGLFPRASYPFAKMLDYWPHAEPPHHLFQFSQTTLSAMVEKAGYRVTGARHTGIDLSYSFGTPESWKASPKMLAYAAVFAPLALIGKWLGRGDWLYLAAKRPKD